MALKNSRARSGNIFSFCWIAVRKRFFKYVTFYHLVPLVALIVAVLYFSVNQPFWDQWELVPVFRNIHSGELSFADVWAQHNEHRMLIPKLIMIGSGMLTGWSTIAECLISISIATASFLIIKKWYQLIKEGLKLHNEIHYFGGLAVLSLIWFSAVQQENWIWGWQIAWFANVLGAVVVVYGITLVALGAKSSKPLLYIVLGALIAQYSLSNGTLLWPLAIAACALLKVHPFRQAIIISCATLSTVFYFLNYANISAGFQLNNLKYVMDLFHYVSIYLGRPITFSHKLAPSVGILLLLLFSWLAITTLKRAKIRAYGIGWIVLGLYAITSAFITAVGRLSFGVDQAYSSRYTTISSLLVVSTLTLLYTNSPTINHIMIAKPKLIVSLGAIFSVLLVTNYGWGIRAMKAHNAHLEKIKLCTSIDHPTDECLALAYPNPPLARERLEYLKKVHLGGY